MVKTLCRVCINVYGRVQGVGYRFFVQRLAQARDLSGFVSNMADGSVAIEAQGRETVIQAFRQELQETPGVARVEEMQVNEMVVIPEEKDFHIRF